MKHREKAVEALERYVKEGGELYSALEEVQRTVFTCQSTGPGEHVYAVLGKCVQVWFSMHAGNVHLVHKEERSSVFQAMK